SLARVEAHRAVAPEHERADVAGAQIVAGDDLPRRGLQLLAAEWHWHVVELGGAQQALGVLGVAEDRGPQLGVVASDALEDAGAVCAVPASPPRSGVLRPAASARSTADSTAAASLSKPRPWRSISAAERNIASGLATPRPAMSGAEPCTGSNSPGADEPSSAS